MNMQRLIYRFTHLNNLSIYLRRQALHAPNASPNDGQNYKIIHNERIQTTRAATHIPCGPRGVIHDYVPFYLGPRSPMLLTISHTVSQNEIIYVYSSIGEIAQSSSQFVFSDGHGIMRLTKWYKSLDDLEKLDWDAINAAYWEDTPDFPDRKRRKQAEFLIHNQCDWNLIKGIAVLNQTAQQNVQSILTQFNPSLMKSVIIKPEWYYREK